MKGMNGLLCHIITNVLFIRYGFSKLLTMERLLEQLPWKITVKELSNCLSKYKFIQGDINYCKRPLVVSMHWEILTWYNGVSFSSLITLLRAKKVALNSEMAVSETWHPLFLNKRKNVSLVIHLFSFVFQLSSNIFSSSPLFTKIKSHLNRTKVSIVQ